MVFGIRQGETGFPWDFHPDIPIAVRVHPLDARHPEVGPVGEQTEELPFSGEPLACIYSIGNEGSALIWQMSSPAPMVIRQHHIAWRQSQRGCTLQRHA